MAFRVTTEQRATASPLDGTVHILESGVGDQAVVWPGLGFNCIAWRVRHQGQLLDLLYADPGLFDNPVPTRSGIPVLFPFPNRIRAGCFTWAGREFHLPLNDPAGKNAIHGFACRHPWRVVDRGADERSAWLCGEFQASREAPQARPLWPADYRLRLTYRLGRGEQGSVFLDLCSQVENIDAVPLPFGLGFHPYFRVPLLPNGGCWLQVPARFCWELAENLPTGVCRPIDPGRDLRQPRRFDELHLDDVLTGLPGNGPIGQVLSDPLGKGPRLMVTASPGWRELVVFTPPHRQAVCLEPYTCPTDAINLWASGLEVGWLVLPPGEKWEEVIRLHWQG